MTTQMDWLAEAFFETPEKTSLDGGTTTLGPLWHGVSPRWGHSMHTMCSYYGMFPAKLVHYFLQRFSEPGDLVLDPFSGRGTVSLQARMEGRRVISNDLNPLAYVLTGAKSNPPAWADIQAFLDQLERDYHRQAHSQFDPDVPEDIRMLFHPHTLRQIVFLREFLLKSPMTDWSQAELMLAGSMAGILHGSHRVDGTSGYLSISMPNTFSMSPSYVKKFIAEKELAAPEQDVFDCLRDKLSRLYLDSIAGADGRFFNQDASILLSGRTVQPGSVDLIVTSPPYLQVVNYGTANWIRLWWLGIEEVGRQAGAGRKSLDAALDHGHSYSAYKDFFSRMLVGMKRVLRKDGVAVLVIGNVAASPGAEPLALAHRLWDEVGDDSGLYLHGFIEDDLALQNKVSRIWGDTKGQATNRDCVLIIGREKPATVLTAQPVDWDEAYKDCGPDAAHLRAFQRIRPSR